MPHKTVIVLGIPRGGTSMVAGIVAKLGIYMGSEYKLAPFYENHELGICIKERDKAKARKIVAINNDRYPTWGIKVLPRGWPFWFIRPIFREPVYIVVFRDVFAIAKRNTVSMNSSLFKEMFIANFLNFCLLGFLAFTKRPALILSYEKALLRPEDTVQGFATFLGITDAILLNEAIQFVKPSPSDYLMRSTTQCQLDANANYFGYVDIVEKNQIAGWVLSVSDKNPVTVELVINGQRKQLIEADLIREDVQKANVKFRENCGFAIALDDANRLKKNDCVEVKIRDSNIHLINSPYAVSWD